MNQKIFHEANLFRNPLEYKKMSKLKTPFGMVKQVKDT